MKYKKEEIKSHFEDVIQGYDRSTIIQLIKDDELHNEIFNTDYYVACYSEANEWLGDHAFEIIGIVKEYEEDNFGEVTTELDNPEKVVNMYVYIVGEDLINEDPRFERD